MTKRVRIKPLHQSLTVPFMGPRRPRTVKYHIVRTPDGRFERVEPAKPLLERLLARSKGGGGSAP